MRLDPLASVGGKGDDRMNFLIITQVAREEELDLPCSDSSLRNYRASLQNEGYVERTDTGLTFTQYGLHEAVKYVNGFAEALGEAIGDETVAQNAVMELFPHLGLFTDESHEVDGSPIDALELYNEVADDRLMADVDENEDAPTHDEVRSEAEAFLDDTEMFYVGSPLGGDPPIDEEWSWPEWPFSDAMLDELDDRHAVAMNAGYKLYRVR